jgi:hypothetical protein
MTKVTLENLDQYGIGHNFTAKVYPQDVDFIVYGNDSEDNLVLNNPEAVSGETPWWKEPSNDRWWKLGPRG